MRANHTKDRLAKGEVAIGCAIQHYRSADIPRTFAAAGFDYAFLDMEHGPFDLETVQDMIAAAVRSGITPVVRVGEMLYSLVARALDAGAQGIIFPRVESPEALREALNWTKFPPQGKRGFGVLPPQIDYEPRSMPAITRHLNENTLVVVQFETRAAMDRREELLALPGIDVAMVGPADLSIALGVSGEVDHPIMIESITALMESCRRHNVVPGIHCRTTAQAAAWIERGMRFVGAGGEHNLLLERARESVVELRQASAKTAARPS
jgi:2-dehydro-3-deoxyglucarate aldolase/4-hydroxy-2-oxoheptanedioate aldolase